MKTLDSALVLFLMVFGLSVKSQQRQPVPVFRNFSAEHGLPSSEVHDIFQDDSGFIWFSTDNGLSRFDGREFKNYSAEAGLTDNVVFKVLEDHQGRLWASTMSGKLYQIEKDSLIAYPHNDVISSYRSGNDHETGVFFGKNGSLLIGLEQKGILTITADGKAQLTQPKQALTIIREDMGQVYSAKYKEKVSWVEVSDNQKVSRVRIETDREMGSGFVYLTQSGKIVVYNSKLMMLVADGKIIRTKEDREQFNQIREEKGKFMVGQIRGGLTIADNVFDYFDGKGRVLFPEYTVSDFLIDQDGGQWFSTVERGVFYCPNMDLVHYGSQFGLNSLTYLSVSIRDESSFYALSAGGNVFLIDVLSNSLTQLPELPPLTNQADVLYCQDSDRLFCLGTKLMEFVNGRWLLLEDGVNGPLRGNKKMHKVPGEPIIFTSGKTGFAVYDYLVGKIIFSGNENVTNDWIRAVHKSSTGQLLIGASNGLFVLENGKLNPPKLRNAELSLRVNDIGELPDGRLVVSTLGGGLLILDGLNLTKLTIDDGLASNMLGSLEVDEFGRIWAASKRGLHLIRQTDSGWFITVFDKQDGLPDTEVVDIDLSLNHIAFCTPAGVSFLPKSIFTEAENPHPVISFDRILIDGSEVEPGQIVKMNSGDNSVSISYNSITFKYPSNIRYGYKILGLSDEWMYTSGPKLYISDLESGKYEIVLQTFGVGQIASNELRLPLEVRKPIWNTWWFIALMLGLLAFLLYGVFVTILRIARKNDINEKKLIQLERSALQAQMNPHFIFNALNSIQSYIAGNENDKATRFLAKFSRLVRMMLNHSMSGRITLRDEIESLTIYLELEQMRFKNKFEFQITVDEEINRDIVGIPPLLIQPYLENAIIHGLSQTRSQGRINLYYMLQDDYIMVTVTDNGIGIEASMNQKSKHASLHKSVGMTITQKRLELLDNANTDKKVKIEEIKDRNGQVLGTKVEVMIKILPDEPLQPITNEAEQ